MATTSTENWEAKVVRKQAALQQLIPEAWRVPEPITSQLKWPLEGHPNRLIEWDIIRKTGILTDKELSITEDYTVPQLLQNLASGDLTAFDVTTAFSKRASIAGQFTNCLTETFFDEALEKAKSLDQMRSAGKLAGPLHGLPISLKDSFQRIGSESTIGYVSYLDKHAEEDSPLIEILTKQGAIVFVKTNIPMTLMTADSHNNIFGRTLNPHNTSLTAGGSSGGEGALVAFRGSPLGVGTDIAGSIRIPALCDGIYGFKPTADRIPYGGQAKTSDHSTRSFLAAAGPLANDLEGIALWTKTVIDAVPAKYDSSVIDVPWRVLQPTAKLRFGFLEPDPMYPLQPPIARSLREAKQLLEDAGHEVVSLPAEETRADWAVEIAFSIFEMMGDNGDRLKASGEPPVPSVTAALAGAGRIPKGHVGDLSTMDALKRLETLTTKRSAYQEAWRRVWNKHRIDAVIAPAAQHTAVAHDQFLIPAYTTLLNCLDVSLGHECGRA